MHIQHNVNWLLCAVNHNSIGNLESKNVFLYEAYFVDQFLALQYDLVFVIVFYHIG